MKTKCPENRVGELGGQVRSECFRPFVWAPSALGQLWLGRVALPSAWINGPMRRTGDDKLWVSDQFHPHEP